MKQAFITLASNYLGECEPFAFPYSTYHDEETGEFSDAFFIEHMDLFRWRDKSEVREYWNIPEKSGR